MRIGIAVNKRRGSEKNGIGIKITGIDHSSFIVGNKLSNYRLSETILNAMVIISMIDQTRDSRTMIDFSMGRLGGRMSVHDRLGGRLSVHDRLGERVGHFPRNQEKLEEMVDARVPDEFIFCRDANIHQVESREVRYQPAWKTKLPR